MTVGFGGGSYVHGGLNTLVGTLPACMQPLEPATSGEAAPPGYLEQPTKGGDLALLLSFMDSSPPHDGQVRSCVATHPHVHGWVDAMVCIV